MGPHRIFGFTIDEWVGIIGIVTAVYGFLVRPLLTKLGKLSESIDQISENSLIEHNRLWRHYDIHDRQLWKHDQEIGILYDRSHLKRSDIKYDDKDDDKK
ncbi:hypothetical protein [Loigolactobacillus coryniformis]|uniref:Uncharacterized protein n=1 Tax=Loigolactobacillus coryniformis subsp. torquens DSM 20004 = KCTC 3535 TaxID=1423822 RepID=A0A2D1KMF4_9LACO|nr:hypothetical protein [Loigolactobacillus coryniformis]ATO43335.1 hypothetical protein LC20004_05180 [Loigolactobacillus coryniformis subsp. torquens DSM 20004 = KCTC 3535]